jgi:predicted signal transduction protein with EAL and GGDEF domain
VSPPAKPGAYLTELPNRSRLLAQFDSLIQTIPNTGKNITVFFVTLDNFKKINDAMAIMLETNYSSWFPAVYSIL